MATPIFFGYHFQVSPKIPGAEILMAELGYAGFESFAETDSGLSAYIQKKDHHGSILDSIQILNNTEFSIEYSVEEIEQVNWNAKWEDNFQPILVDDRCMVRAPFHSKIEVEFDVIIEPKMSFGTGHHETTHMMIQLILESDMHGKSILDMGCGTGVLAILAAKKGAQKIDAIDIDDWCYLNTIENNERNHCQHITVSKGDASLIKNKSYDVILANINRNILIQDIPQYSTCLNPNGLLLLSGFYKQDIPVIQQTCSEHGLRLISQTSKNKWVALKFNAI